jgi:HK97 family phage major capsid protein
MTLKEVLEKAKKERNEKRAQLKAKIKETRALTDGGGAKMGDMQACVDACKTLQSDIDKLDKDIATLAEACGLTETNDDESADTETDPTNTERNDPHQQAETRSLKGKLPSISVVPNTRTVSNKNADEEVRAFDQYMRSRGETRDGLTTTGTEVTIPKAVMDLYKQPPKTNQLSTLVNKQTVSLPAGTLPILKKQGAGLVTKEELANVPGIDAPQFIPVPYQVQTYSGKLPVSQESLDDGQVNIDALVSEFVHDARNLTEQRKIGGVLATATALPATSLDEIKDIFNVQIPIGYSKQFIVSQSAYAVLDKLKDGNGRYLLQDSITASSGKIILGAPVTIVEDEVLGAAGDSKVFVGDPKSFVLEAMRTDATAKWVQNDVYGVNFYVYFRADFKKADPDAGKFVTLKFA